nr:unnamed protein product [Spirometra erinaceieuropaei]
MSSGTRDQSIDEPFSVGRPTKDYEGTDDLKPIKDEDKLGITLAAAVLPTSTPHYCVNPPSYSNLPLKLTAFDEKEDFSAWLRRSQFHVGVVPTDKQSVAFLQCLTPNQLDRALDAGLFAETPIGKLCQELEKLLKPTMSRVAALNQLYSRRRRIGDTANEFADALYRLCKSAYPSISQTDCSDAVLYHFIKYIEPPELRRSLLLQPPRDLKEAIDRVNIYAKIPHNELSPQPSFRNSQAQNWRRYDTGNQNRSGPFNRPQYPKRGGYNPSYNRQGVFHDCLPNPLDSAALGARTPLSPNFSASKCILPNAAVISVCPSKNLSWTSKITSRPKLFFCIPQPTYLPLSSSVGYARCITRVQNYYRILTTNLSAPAYLDISSHPPFTVPVNFVGQSVQAVVDTGASVFLVNINSLQHNLHEQMESLDTQCNL